MYRSEIKLRVRYSETDKMGYSYYGNYAAYFEIGRVEALRKLNLNYKDLEDSGIMLPVLEYAVKFFKPAFYDDELTIKTTISEMPGVRIHFDYETFNESGELLNKARVTLVFIDHLTRKPCLPPKSFIQTMAPFFNHD